MRKRAILLILLAAAILFMCGSAMAEGQTNPRRKHVEKTIQWRKEKRIPGLFRTGGPALIIECDEEPALGEPGKFTVTVNNSDDDADWYYEYGISDTGRDEDGYVYFGEETDSNVFEGFTFYTAGEYELSVFLYQADDLENTVARASFPFTVEPKTGYPTLEEKAQEIVDECSAAGDTWQTALNLHDWLTEHTYYDLNYEYYGADVLFRGKGVCDSYSKAFKLLCNTAGITVERVTSNDQNHAWNVIKFGDTWYQVDVTWDDPSGGTEAVSGREHYAYYCLSDEVMFLDHTHYDVSFDPGCTSMAMNYYIKTGTWQAFGQYDNSGNTVIGYFLNQLDLGYAHCEFPLDDWVYYWPGGGTGYGMMAVRYGIYVAGMQQTDWELENGGALKADIRLEYDDGFVTLDARWDLEETGTLLLPPLTKTIGENAFENTGATTVVIPDGCTTIGAEAFKNSGVRTMDVPATVTTVADSAFDGCGRILFILHEADSDFADFARQKGHLVAEP